MEYENEQRPYEGMSVLELSRRARKNTTLAPTLTNKRVTDEQKGYDRDRSRSPRPEPRDNGESRLRSASPNGRGDRMDDR